METYPRRQAESFSPWAESPGQESLACTHRGSAYRRLSQLKLKQVCPSIKTISMSCAILPVRTLAKIDSGSERMLRACSGYQAPMHVH